MRIALVTHVFPPDPISPKDSAAIFIPQVAKALAQRGHEVFVVAPDVAAEKRSPDDYKVIWFPWMKSDLPLHLLKPIRPAHALRLLSFYRQGVKGLLDAHQRFALDVCLACWGIPAGHFCRLLKRRAGVPYLAWCLGSDVHTFGKMPVLRRLLKKALVAADALAADGVALAGEVESIAARPCRFIPMPHERLRVAGPAPDWPSGRFHVLCVGRQTPIKGQRDLLEALRSLPKDSPIRVHFVGAGPCLEAYKSLAAEWALGDRACFHGFVDDETLAAFYKAAHAVAVPSHNESIPQVLLEAMKSRRPLLVTDVGDMGRIVGTYEIGRVAPPRQPAELARRLMELIGFDASPGYAKKETRQFLEQFETDYSASRLSALLAAIANR